MRAATGPKSRCSARTRLGKFGASRRLGNAVRFFEACLTPDRDESYVEGKVSHESSGARFGTTLAF